MDSIPILKLVCIEFNGKEFLKFCYKRNPEINGALSGLKWIRYSRIFGAYVMHNTAREIKQLTDLLKGKAIVNASLAYKNGNSSSRETTIELSGASVQKASVKKVTITLIDIVHGARHYIKFRGNYTAALYRLIMKDEDIIWSVQYGCFITYADAGSISLIVCRYRNLVHFVVDQSLKIIDNGLLLLLWEQSLKAGSKTCPVSLINRMHLDNCSMHTMRSYHAMLLKFLNYYPDKSIEEINQFDLEVINAYHVQSVQEGRSFSWIRLSINALKYYYCNILHKGYDFSLLERPRNRSKELPRVLSKDSIEGIIGRITNVKHKCLIMLLYSSGLRVSELIHLRLGDIQLNMGILLVKSGKGKKDRITVLGKKIVKYIEQYLAKYKPVKWLFEGPGGNAYSSSSVRQIITHAAEGLQIPIKPTPHIFRHSFATHSLEMGTDLRHIQTLLGHQSTRTTEIYTHVTNNDLEKIPSPLDRLDI